MNLRSAVAACLSAVALMASAYSHAAPVAVDLTGLEEFSGLSNVFRSGVRISPNCNFSTDSIIDLRPPAIYFDAAGCQSELGEDGGFNRNFLGPAQYEPPTNDPVLYVDAYGAPFSLLNITIGVVPFILETSRDSITFPFSGVTSFDFSRNAAFSDITYFLVRYSGSDQGAPALGFSNVVVDLQGKISTPGTLGLLSLGALAFVTRSRIRSKRASQTQAASL